MGRVLLQALLVMAVFAVAFGVTVYLRASVTRLRARRSAKADREVPWAPYCRPISNVFVIGVERVTDDGRVLNRTEIRTVPIHDELERLVAENEAEMRAKAWNDAKVGI